MQAEVSSRVRRHTPAHINEKIQEKLRSDIRQLAQAGPEAIERRLKALEKEWDIERTLEANAATLSLLGLFLGKTVSPKFYWFSIGVGGFLLQHAVQGWCPPLPVLRRLGIRTMEEIDAERCALNLIRGYRKNQSAVAAASVKELDEEGVIGMIENEQLT